MSLPTLNQVRARVRSLASQIGAPTSALPTFGHSEQSGRPHVEVDSRGLHYVVAERGTEFSRITTRSLDEVLWNVFSSVTHELAFSFEFRNRTDDKLDCRRMAFAKQLELMSVLSATWASRFQDERRELLVANPFHDTGHPVADAMDRFLAQGAAFDVAWQRAQATKQA